jgi:hypothetical protein
VINITASVGPLSIACDSRLLRHTLPGLLPCISHCLAAYRCASTRPSCSGWARIHSNLCYELLFSSFPRVSCGGYTTSPALRSTSSCSASTLESPSRPHVHAWMRYGMPRTLESYVHFAGTPTRSTSSSPRTDTCSPSTACRARKARAACGRASARESLSCICIMASS